MLMPSCLHAFMRLMCVIISSPSSGHERCGTFSSKAIVRSGRADLSSLVTGSPAGSLPLSGGRRSCLQGLLTLDDAEWAALGCGLRAVSQLLVCGPVTTI
ncbi:hypothetical protein EDB81DRAFT_153993 [Dactylonectria macrodidyma]|uniref:Secreted protein n=1 Tax=Dactylonectria macrodidyma TaxID=307937 RepID=A0A9P9JKT5_9HYPO|nr:hypothetical protein EDB81DRAFT_153993 [Dactylonectria macrodidyma]